MSFRSAEDVRQRRLKVLGEELGSVFDALSNEYFWLQFRWQEYVELFGTSQERIGILNSAAPGFFHIVQNSLWDDMMIHLARLTDRPRTVGKSNLTFLALPDLIEGELSSVVRQLVETATAATSFARDWRNRRLAHRDLALALGTAAEPLAAASRAKFGRSMDSLHAVLGSIHMHYFDSDLHTEVMSGGFGAVRMLQVLRNGLEAEDRRQERLRSGQLADEDYRPPEPL